MSRKDINGPATKRRKLSNGSAAHREANGATAADTDTTHQAHLANSGSRGVGSTPMISSRGTQTTELLGRVTPKHGARYKDSVILAERIAETLRDLSPEGPFTSHEAVQHAQHQSEPAIPFPAPRLSKESKLKLESAAPSKVDIGTDFSRSLNMQANSAIVIDVQMPSTLFQDKDYLNLRAFHKRAFYLARCAAALRNTFAEEVSIEYRLKDDVALMPVLILSPSADASSQRTTFEINVSFPHDSFPIAKLSPEKACVRSQIDSSPAVQSPTPFYNSCLRYLASTFGSHDLIKSAATQSPSFGDSVRLGVQWLAMREMSSSVSGGGFGLNEWAIISALLLKTGGPRGQPLFSNRYSAIQLFKAMLQVLASRDMYDPWILRGQSAGIEKTNSPFVYDAESGYNVLFKMSAASYETLRNYARESLTQINRKDDEGFDQTFNLSVSQPLLQYDEIYLVKGLGFTTDSTSQLSSIEEIGTLLKKGLGDRIRHIDIRPEVTGNWSTNVRNSTKNPVMQISLMQNSKTALRLVDHGPSAEDQDEASEFRQFWGDKAELRRFKDGSISESLVWTSAEPVTSQIIRHLLHRHLSIDPSLVRLGSLDLEQEFSASLTTAKQHFAIVDQAFQKLSTSLLGLSDLPLPVRSVTAVSESLRSSALAIPAEAAVAGPVEVLVEFDSSGRWPDALPAIQYTKIAFLVKLGDVMISSNPSISYQVGLENSDADVSGYLNTSYLDLTYPSPGQGFGSIIFRLRIVHERELHLLQSESADKSLSPSSRELVTTAVASYKRNFVAAPKHTTALRVLLTQFPALSSTIRLLKKWSCAHLLGRHVPSEILELIACHVFVQPSPWDTPASSTTAFMRCLSLLSRWDWVSRPLVVDLTPGQDMTKSQHVEIDTRFQAWRKLDPMMNQVSWFMGSSTDETGVVWTAKSRMEKVVAARVQAIAKACLDVLTAPHHNLSRDIARSIFVPPLKDYDFLISLHKKVLAKQRRSSGSSERFRNLAVQTELDTGTIGFHPVEDLLQDLDKAFGHVALFLYGASENGDSIIAGLWRPHVQGTKDWRVRLGWSTVPQSNTPEQDSGKELCSLDTAGILSEIGMLGRDLIKEIKVQK